MNFFNFTTHSIPELTLLLGLVGMISGWILLIVNRRFDERRHFRQLAVDSAIESWKQEIANANYISERTKIPKRVASLDSFIIHMLLVAELISKRGVLNASTIESELRKIRAISEQAGKAGFPEQQKPNPN